MERVGESWAAEREEPLAPWVRRALLTAEESEGEGATVLLERRLHNPRRGEDWDDEREEPVRGPLRRALLAADP